jgi:acyl-coenzyme A thioesterase PaaI-like protein
MTGLDTLIVDYIEADNLEPDNAEFIIKVSSEICDKDGKIDNGVLLALVDSYSSFSGTVLLKNGRDSFSVSVNLTLTSFGDMLAGNDYRMKVLLNHEDKNLIYYNIELYDKHNKLIKKGSHLKRRVKVKF